MVAVLKLPQYRVHSAQSRLGVAVRRANSEVGVAVYEMHGLGVELPGTIAVLHNAQGIDPEVALPQPTDQEDRILYGPG